MTQHIGLSNKTDQWFTPPEILNRVSKVFTSFMDLDPCGSVESNKMVQANKVIAENGVDYLHDAVYWYQQSGGLSLGNIFCNPPSGKYSGTKPEYRGLSNPAAFFKALNFDYDNGICYQYIFLGYSIEQLQTIQAKTEFPDACLICIPKQRVRFVDQSGNRNSPTHGNFIVYRGPHPHRFHREFESLGMILKPTN